MRVSPIAVAIALAGTMPALAEETRYFPAEQVTAAFAKGAVLFDGTFAAGARISIGKARTAALFKKPTSVFEDIIKNGRTAMVALEDFTPLQGGVPIEVDGKVVGAIGVSGAASQQRDEEVAKAGAAAVK